ncbi:MAG: PadR family transcriptional regulator [Alloacidobacterium sp.]|jgi:PadR family transcriptional regulator PadR
MRSQLKTELPQVTLDLLILRTVAHGPIHRYVIAQRILQISRQALQVQQGSLYPALHRLEYRKLIVSEWAESDSRRRAKFYRLPAKGRAHLKSETESWARLIEAVGLILQSPEGELS